MFLKEFFEVDDGGVKKPALEKTCMQLKTSIKLYRQTTETLMAEFMKDAASVGEINDLHQTGQLCQCLLYACVITNTQETLLVVMHLMERFSWR